MTDKQTLLEKTEIFSHLAADEIETLASCSEFKTFDKGFKVFTAGDPGKELYIVRKGEILISRKTSEGKELDLARVISGEMFGEMDLFQNSKRNADARAATDTSLLLFPGNGYSFESILHKYPTISAKILHKFLTVIAGRIRNTNKLITENSPVIRELKNQVYRDKLTGIFNRAYIEEQLPGFLNNPKRPVSLLMVKPDNFKYINDNFGHEAGDQSLRILAGAYQNLIGDELAVARFMGNEFALILDNTGKKNAEDFARRIQETLAGISLQEVTGENRFRLTASIGIAVFPDHGKKAGELIEKAHELPLIGRAQGGGKILFPESKEKRRSRD